MELLGTILNLFKEFDGLIIVLLVYLILEIRHIRKDLSNHITETNDKIEKLSGRFDNLSGRLDQQKEYFDNRFDRQREYFDRLYEVLLKDKKAD